MPLHMEIHRLSRTIVIVARGQIAADDVAGCAREIVDANVRHFAKIIDVSASSAEVSREQLAGIATWLRDKDGARGPMALVVDPEHHAAAHDFAEVTRGDRPVKLFRSLHDARRWIASISGETGR